MTSPRRVASEGARFTPGPWGLWSEEGTTKAGDFLFSICRNNQPKAGLYLDYNETDGDHGHQCIAEARGKTEEECFANAALIAAAPDMYEALREALPLFEPDEGIAVMILAALAKAEGR